MEIKGTNVLLSPEEIIELMAICEDADKDNALSFLKKLHKRIEKAQGGFRSSYQRGGHIGQPRF